MSVPREIDMKYGGDNYLQIGGQYEIVRYPELGGDWLLFPVGAQVSIGRYKDKTQAKLAAIMLFDQEEEEVP